MRLGPLLASIPSPSSNRIGPFHVYGVLLAIAALLGVEIAERRWRRRGNPAGGIYDVAFPIIVGGVIGARLYHVATDWQRFEHDLVRVVELWKGGLSIWGAVLGGVAGAVLATRRRHLHLLEVMDCIAPGLLVAQALGRWGNWFNQELFGKPTSLPWGLEISPANRPAGYARYATFHPTFLYESLWCLLVLGVLLGVERRRTWRRGQAFALYVVLYTFGRFWFENLRIDPAHHIGPLRVNAWVSVVAFVVGAVWFVWLAHRPPDADERDADQRDHRVVRSHGGVQDT